MNRVLCRALAFFTLAGVGAHGQQPGPAFEVASVKPHQGTVQRTGPLAVSGPLIRLQGYTLFGLVMDAYNLRDFQLTFGPAARRVDAFDTMYDISARAPGPGIPKLEDVRTMLRTLLEDRFGLKVHLEMREMPVYELVAGKITGSLVPAASGEPCSVRTRLASDGRNNEEVFLGCPMERVADTLTHLVGGRPVLDRTGLTGQYDLRLTAIPGYRVHNPPEPADIDPIAAVERLGLKMVARKAPIRIVVVDALEKPGEN